ncbi:MAG: NUDIX domain-containing protein [Tannerella sp.]|jgi:ADP-ribose pyrophosphatase YjhB (NUDIX family)|nr:NUDIX domain-containing protein [Tannerella sp.]
MIEKEKKFYIQHPRFYVAVDCIIFGFDEGKLKLLLLKRNFEPAKGQWSLMGGFVQKNESADNAAKRVLRELTGLENVYMEQVGAFGEIERDPGERVISIAYYALIKPDDYDKKLVKQHNACWVNIDELPTLIFDHDMMVEKARNMMKRQAVSKPICFRLLPELFTLTQLQTLYEVIYGETLDKRNFRKRVADMDFIEITDKIDKTGSKRGARLYRMNPETYCKSDRKLPFVKL